MIGTTFSTNPVRARLKQNMGVTSNPLEAGFMLEDGKLIKVQNNTHLAVLTQVKGFDKFMNCSMRNKIILYLLMWHTNCLRIHIRTSQNNELAVQLWAQQKVTDRQWKKLDFLISIMGKTMFYYDIITILQGTQRYFQEIKNPRNSLPMRKAYEEIRKTLKMKS